MENAEIQAQISRNKEPYEEVSLASQDDSLAITFSIALEGNKSSSEPRQAAVLQAQSSRPIFPVGESAQVPVKPSDSQLPAQKPQNQQQVCSLL